MALPTLSMCNHTRAVLSKTILFWLIFVQPNQNVLLSPPHWATSVLHLMEPGIATILVTITAVANVLRTSHSHVLILTQPLELESGSQHFALQKAVAAKVSGGDSIAISLFTNLKTAMLSGVVERNVKHFPFLQTLLATGIVTSPNYPDNYPNNLYKTETIQVEEGFVILLQFTAFHTHNCNDRLTITDGDGTTLLGRACGSSLPNKIKSSSNFLEMFFKTDAKNTHQGWSANWIAVTAGK